MSNISVRPTPTKQDEQRRRKKPTSKHFGRSTTDLERFPNNGKRGMELVVGEVLTKLAEIVDAGALTPQLDSERFGLEEVGAAYARLTGGAAIGKVVVEV